MKIDLHIHTSTGSDGNFSVEEVFKEAKKRNLSFISITDHDSIDAQERSVNLAKEYNIAFITGIELNVTLRYERDKSASLDFLGYDFNIYNEALNSKLKSLKDHRETRAHQILSNLNSEFDKEKIERFTEKDIQSIQASANGALGRPHIANYLTKKGIVKNKQEAFDKYLMKCDVPKFPLTLEEASKLVKDASGKLILAHPNDPQGTSLIKLTTELDEQSRIIEKYILDYIDGIECWHSRNDNKTTDHYVKFTRENHLIATGGSDCHQKPIILGSLDIPDYIAKQFNI